MSDKSSCNAGQFHGSAGDAAVIIVSDPFSFQQDGLAASEVDVGRRQVCGALVVSQVVTRPALGQLSASKYFLVAEMT